MSTHNNKHILFIFIFPLTSILLLLQSLNIGVASFEQAATAVSPPQPYLVKDIYEGSNSGFAGMRFKLTTYQDELYIFANDGISGEELWKSDGTLTNTTLLKDIQPGITSSFFFGNAISQDTLYFVGSGDALDYALWRTNGTEASTEVIQEFSGSSPGNLTAVDDNLYFSANISRELWKSDGTITETKMIRVFNQGGQLNYFTSFNNMLFFRAYEGQEFVDTEFRFELWRSDGTITETVRVKDIYPGTEGDPSPTYLTVVDNKLFFVATDPNYGRELWVTDGTEAGTRLVKDINSGGDSSPTNLTNVNGKLYFAADDGSNGKELWVSDGTETGTYMLKNIHPSDSSNPIRFIGTNSLLFFMANNGVDGEEIWVSDGTENGTMLVKDVNPSGNSSTQYQTTQFGTTGLYFISLDDGVHGVEWWRSDGTPDGTYMIADIDPAGDGVGWYPGSPGYANGRLLFSASDGIKGYELWGLDIAQREYEVNPNASSLQTITTFDQTITMDIPTNSLPANASYLKYIDGRLLHIDSPPNNIGIMFSLTLLDDNGDLITNPQFSPPLTTVIPYDPVQIPIGMPEALLLVQFYNTATNSWQKIPVKLIDTENHEISVELTHFTAFSMSAPENVYFNYLPTVMK